MGEMKDQLVIDSQMEETVRARHWTAKHARLAGFDSASIFEIELAVGEALANVIEHAYESQPGQEIHLLVDIDDYKFCLNIRDFGRKFDTANYRPPNLDVAKEGGYGVYLIEQVMDEVNYSSPKGKGTQLTLVKYKSDEVRQK